MRSTIVIATCALAVFAAPVPEPKPFGRVVGGGGCSGYTNGKCIRPGKRDTEASIGADIQYHLPDVSLREESRSVQASSSMDDEIKKRDANPEPAVRQGDGDGNRPRRRSEYNNRRYAEAEPVIRGPPTRRSDENTRRNAEAEPVIRGPPTRRSDENTRRDAEADPIFRASYSGNGKRADEVEAEEIEQDIEARATRNQGRRSAEPFTRVGHPSGRSAEAEPIFRASYSGNGKRADEVEAEEIEQDIEARATRNEGRRSAEPFTRVGHPSGRSAEAAPAVRNPDP